MIAGLGFDLVEIERVAAVLRRHGDAFLDRVLHASEDRERLRLASGATHLAGAFAAKEAVLKALGCGLFDLPLSDIAVRNEASGKPYLTLHGRALAHATKAGVGAWLLSISHSRLTAGAVAVALRA